MIATSAPVVSVVMPVYNGEAYLAEAVESILSQTLRDLELVIIDDGSTDGTASILRRYGQADRRVRVQIRTHRGLVAALNEGCGLARGTYIARMDADDVALPDRLQKEVAFLEAHPDVAVVGGCQDVVNEHGDVIERIRMPEGDADIRARIGQENAMSHPTAMFRKEVFERVGGYRLAVAYAEDYDLWLRIAERHQLANLPDTVLRYRIHAGASSVRSRKQQVLAKLAARRAAEIRRETGHDPLDGVALVTPAVLGRLGVGAGALEAVLAESYIRTAYHLAQTRDVEAGRDFLARAQADMRAEGAANSLVASLHWESANLAARQGYYGPALRSALCACVLSPASSKRLLRWLRRLGSRLKPQATAPP